MKTARFTAFLSLFLWIGSQAVAQSDPDQLFYTKKLEKARSMKTAGIFLTVTGAILLVVGVNALANSDYHSNYYYNSTSSTTQNDYPVGGLLCTDFGVIGMGGGITMWVIGSKRQKKFQNLLEHSTVGLNLNHQMGLRMTYRF